MMKWNENINIDDQKIQNELRSINNLPRHVAIIMDGNGRWAKLKNIPRLFGHKEGIESVKDVVRTSSNIGIKYLTLYAFSIENWKRPDDEVNGLMKLLDSFMKSEIEELHRNNVKINLIGKISSLPKFAQDTLHMATKKTESNDGLVLTLALSYGSRWDIVRAVQLISMDVRRGKLSPEDINEENFSNYLSTFQIPDPDLLIRTSGEFRISNFLLWELAYSEIYITEKLWPKFRKNDLYDALYDYLKRERRFGKTSDQLEKNSYFKKVVNAIKNS